MRLLQLVTGPGELIDLHPNVTILQGMDEERRDLLRRTVVGLAQGRAVGEGLLEVHGVLFGLDDRHLAVLDLAADVDPVVRRPDLPGGGSLDALDLDERREQFEALLPLVASRVELQTQARETAAAALAALDRARAAHAEASAVEASAVDASAAGAPDPAPTTVEELEDRLLGEWAQLEAARSARQALEQEVTQLNEAVQVAAARTAGLVERLGTRDQPSVEVEPVEGTLDSATDDGPPESSASQVDDAEARLASLDTRLAVLDVQAPERIEEAVRLVRAGAELVPSAEARALAEEIEALDHELGDVAAAEAPAAAVATARARLDDARQALLDAEADARAPVLSRVDVDELEQAHDAVQDAIERTDGALSGGRARRRLEERRAAEQVILDRLGFRSYADYVMGSSTRHHDPQREATLTAAREELREAEAQWHDLQLTVEHELRRAERLDHRRVLSERARALLGTPVARDEEAAALQVLRVPAVDVVAAVTVVRRALDDLGIDLGDENLDLEELALVAESALDAAADGERRRYELVEERAAVATELAHLRGDGSARPAPAPAPDEHDHRLFSADEPEPAPVGDPEPDPDPDPDDEGDDEELRSAQALEAAAQAAVERARAELERAAAAEASIAEQVAASETELEAATASDLSDELAAAQLEVTAHVEALAASVEAAETEHQQAEKRVEAEDQALDVLDQEGRALAAQIERLEDLAASQAAGTATSTDELEWYLLARLAGQRSVSVVGSLPLLLDDALVGIDPEQVSHLLDRLERMADAVQLIVVSDDPSLEAWVASVGPARAAIVRPSAA
jgi:hypothetical protein